MNEAYRMYSDSASGVALSFDEERERRNVEKKGGRNNYCTKGRALFPPPLSIVQQDIRNSSHASREQVQVQERRSTKSRNQRILTCQHLKLKDYALEHQTKNNAAASF
jgi:hypothetical protein